MREKGEEGIFRNMTKKKKEMMDVCVLTAFLHTFLAIMHMAAPCVG